MRPFLSLRPGSRFGSIYRSGTRKRAGGITVLQAAGQAAQPELGVVAGKNVGNAVERNRAKRRLREAARRVDLRPDTAYVVVASHEVLDARFGDLVTWMDEAAIAGGDRRKDGK